MRSIVLISFVIVLLALPLVFSRKHHAATASPAPSTELPRNVIYVQTFINADGSQLSLLPLLNQKTRVTHVILAALHVDSQVGQVHLNDNDPNSAYYNWLWPQVKTLQKNGIKVMMMMGGAATGSYQNLQKDFKAYYPPLLERLKNHTIDGLDLDIEEDVSLEAVLQLLRQLNTDMGPDFILTSAPEATGLVTGGGSLTNFSYFDLDKQAVDKNRKYGKLIEFYNAQCYNGWGDASSTATYDSMIKSGWSPSRVVMGVSDSSNDGGGFVGLSTLKSVIAQLRKKYSDFGGVDGWEYFDAGKDDNLANPWQWVQAIGDSLYDSSTDQHHVEYDHKKYQRTNFDAQLDELVEEGIPYVNALISLNKTAGDIEAARKWLAN